MRSTETFANPHDNNGLQGLKRVRNNCSSFDIEKRRKLLSIGVFLYFEFQAKKKKINLLCPPLSILSSFLLLFSFQLSRRSMIFAPTIAYNSFFLTPLNLLPGACGATQPQTVAGS
jgi:hypothetical protein